MTAVPKPLLLIILDGLGCNPNPRGNAVLHAKTPNLDRIAASVPQTQLITCGPRVGLPEGQMGNSEVGHLNIGAGRVVEQELLRINRTVAQNALCTIAPLRESFDYLRSKPTQALHLIGLMSSGGVHSSIEHAKALAQAAAIAGVSHIYIHAITDGRDTAPQCAWQELSELERFIKSLSIAPQEVRIVNVIGRYYAMDRDKRWDRTQLAYDLFTKSNGESYQELSATLRGKKEGGEYDEFLKPLSIAHHPSSRTHSLADGDVVLCTNFRADRMRQIVRAMFAREGEFHDFKRSVVPKLHHLFTLTEYDSSFPVTALFPPAVINQHLGQLLSEHGFSQLRIAETEKYAHVTYFFNGGVEKAFPGETRILIPSPRDVATYDEKPEMSAIELTERLLQELASNRHAVYVVNYANCDMVGHTGNFDAAVRAVETVDTCLGKVLALITQKRGTAIVTADHGNAEQMIDYDTGEPHTAHTMFPVPLYLVADSANFGSSSPETKIRLDSGGALCDIAPTICELLNLPQPEAMTGRSLILKNKDKK